jgi:hypothetical protein
MNSSADEAWQLLQQYLDRYEDRTAQYHRCTATKLLTHGFTLPTWLVISYKVWLNRNILGPKVINLWFIQNLF